MDRKIEKKKWTWQRILLIAIIAAAVIYFGRKMYQSAGTSRLNVVTERLLMDTVHQGVFQEYIPVTGVVQPIKTIFIDAVEGGKVEEKLVEDGAMVDKNQVLLKLSNPDLLSNFLNQEANIIAQINQIRNTSLLMEQQSLNLKEQALSVEYQIDLISKRLERNRKLYEGKVVSKVEVEEMEDEFENLLRRKQLLRATIEKDSAYQELQQIQMESSLDLMERNLEITRQSLDNLIVRAPIDGQISGLTLEIGELVTEGENIATLDNLENFKLQVRVDQFYISRVFLNQEGSFEFAGKEYYLRINKIYPQVNNGAFLVDMIFTGDTPEGIKRGQSVSVKLELSAEEEGRLLARGGFYQTTGGNWVYLVDPSSGNAFKRNIRLGRQNPNYYLVEEGLDIGDVVIVSSYENFGDKDELVLK
ncbi:MAG: HlyD family efflux transporter periplasmic adaptor subunit [Saprospiraceae bacterium]|nr:HlyD family efflux transporter periplasmic adaptor subunit [Saprospiraceae bacterium]